MTDPSEKEDDKPSGMTAELWVKLAAIVLPILATATFGIVGYYWTQSGSSSESSKPATTAGVNVTGDNNVTGNNNVVNIVNLTYDQAQSALDESPNDEKTGFIGAIDGIYEYRKQDLLQVRAEASNTNNELTLIYANCAVTGPLLQQGNSWLFYKATTDGVCAFLNAIGQGYPVARIIPQAGSLSNNGRVNGFFVESGEFAVNQFSGFYEWKEWIE